LSLQRALLTLIQELAELWNNWDRHGREIESLRAGCRIAVLLLHSVLVWYRNGIEEVAAELIAFAPREDIFEAIVLVGPAVRILLEYTTRYFISV
jgi:hypothetical protein